MRRLRNVKIVATLGPASNDYATIRALFEAGADVFRLNMSHGTHDDIRARHAMIRQIEADTGRPIAILADLQGPKLRVGVFADGAADLVDGAPFRMDLDPAPGTVKRVNLPHPEIFAALEPGASLLVNDGKIRLRVNACGKDFGISVKLNSSDFQQGAFTLDECRQVVSWLGEAGIDLLEVSGGTYEQPAMVGQRGSAKTWQDPLKESTRAREAYFVDFAKAMREQLSIPLMATGGFRTRAAMEQAVEAGAADIIGIARPLCVDPAGAAHLLAGEDALPRPERELALLPAWMAPLRAIKMVRALDGFAVQYWYYSQINALGQTGHTAPDRSVFSAMREVEGHAARWLKAHRASRV